MSDDEQQRQGFVNLGGTDCPKCGQRMPAFRVPANLHQLMWGGWTCPNCGCDMDKWGKPKDAEGSGSNS
jgi:hypothetical protein